MLCQKKTRRLRSLSIKIRHSFSLLGKSIFICFICAAVFPFFSEKDHEIALIDHGAIAKIDAFIPPLKGGSDIYDLIVILLLKDVRGLTQIPFLPNTKDAFDPQYRMFFLYFLHNRKTKRIKFSEPSEIKSATAQSHRLPNLGGRYRV